MTKQKLIVIVTEVIGFAIENLVAWYDPVLGIYVGIFILLLHLVQILLQEEEL